MIHNISKEKNYSRGFRLTVKSFWIFCCSSDFFLSKIKTENGSHERLAHAKDICVHYYNLVGNKNQLLTLSSRSFPYFGQKVQLLSRKIETISAPFFHLHKSITNLVNDRFLSAASFPLVSQSPPKSSCFLRLNMCITFIYNQKIEGNDAKYIV